jgi:hypothetical protein
MVQPFLKSRTEDDREVLIDEIITEIYTCAMRE